MAGRKFGASHDRESVAVYELEQPLSLQDTLDEESFDYETIAGVSCFVAKAHADTPIGASEDWVAVVDKKFLVMATRRAILTEVLTGRGARAAGHVERMGWKLEDVNWGSPVLVMRKNEPAQGKPPAIERMLLTFAAGTERARLDVVAKDRAAALKELRAIVVDRRDEGPIDEDKIDSNGFGRVDLVSSDANRHVFRLTLPQPDFPLGWPHTLDSVFRGKRP